MKHNYIVKETITEENAKDIVGKDIKLGELKCLLTIQSFSNNIALEWAIDQSHKGKSPRVDFIFTYKNRKFMLEFNGYQHFGLCDLNEYDKNKLLNYQQKFIDKQKWGLKNKLLIINYNVLMNNKQHHLDFIDKINAKELQACCDLLISGSIGPIYNYNSI